MVKTPSDNAGAVGDLGSIPGSGRSPGGGNGNPLQYSCPENPTDRGAWRAAAHRAAQSGTRLSGMQACQWSSCPGPSSASARNQPSPGEEGGEVGGAPRVTWLAPAEGRCTREEQGGPQEDSSGAGRVSEALSRVQLFAAPWTVARQAPLSTGFSAQGYWSG